MVEGAENGDDAVADGLALLDRLPHHRRSLTERIHPYCYAHFSLSLSLSQRIGKLERVVMVEDISYMPGCPPNFDASPERTFTRSLCQINHPSRGKSKR